MLIPIISSGYDVHWSIDLSIEIVLNVNEFNLYTVHDIDLHLELQ